MVDTDSSSPDTDSDSSHSAYSKKNDNDDELKLKLWSMDAITLSEAIRGGRITCEQLMEATLDRIEELNPRYNAIILLKDRKSLLEQARDMDEARARAQRARTGTSSTFTSEFGWLYGIPVAIKDVSNAEGFPTTLGGSRLVCGGNGNGNGNGNGSGNGSDSGATGLPPEALVSDPYVASMVRDGAIVIGKTNAPEGGLGSNTFNDVWGKTRNALLTTTLADNDNDTDNDERDLSAGGSSGGAAVAVATRMLALADGTDNMGSLRNPAGWNGIYSHRPTAGWIPSGVNNNNNNNNNTDSTPLCVAVSTILPHPASTAGPMARTPLDCARLLQTMVGDTSRFDAGSLFDVEDNSSNNYGTTTTTTTTTPARIVIGWLGDWQGRLPMDDGILATCQTVLEDWSANKSNTNNNTNSNANRFDIVVVNAADGSVLCGDDEPTDTDHNSGPSNPLLPLPLFDLDELWEGYNTIRFASTYEKYSCDCDSCGDEKKYDDVEHLLSPEGRTMIKEELAWELEMGRAIATSGDRGKAQLERARAIHERYEAWLEGILRNRNRNTRGNEHQQQHESSSDNRSPPNNNNNNNAPRFPQPQPFDVLALPSAQVWPFPIDDRYPKQIGKTPMDTYHRWMEVCVPVSFGGLPCITIPTTEASAAAAAAATTAAACDDTGNNTNTRYRDGGRTKRTNDASILPMGIQLFGKRGDDLRLLSLANDYYRCFHHTSREMTE
eukprot:jgi/Psemu1/23680/gm1.23680_g